jgi:signal transduction histidine kinase
MSTKESPDTGLRLDEIMSGAWSQAELVDALQEIADGVYGVVGFGVAAISVLRDNDELEIVAVSGNADAREELLGKRRALSTLEADIAMADWWGPLCFVPEERVVDRLEDPGWVPDVTPLDDPNAWKPLDFLFSPLRDDVGDPVGVLAVDLPSDGLRPDQDRQRLLQRYADYSAKAVNALLARERLTERLRLAETARTIIRQASAQLDLNRILADCQQAIVEGFGAHGMWIQTFEGGSSQGHGAIFAAGGTLPQIDEELVRIAVDAAQSCWDEQRVVFVSRRRPPTQDALSDEQREFVLDFMDRIGIVSLLFVPLGAGPECLGNLVLTRTERDPEWTQVEADAAFDIGHDLGRAVLNARLFQREKQLLEEMRELDSYKSQLIKTVSHEFKNPLTSILGHLELMENVELDAMGGRSLEVIARNTNRLQRLVTDMLLLSSVGDPNRPLDAREVDLREVIEDVNEIVGVQAEARAIKILVDAPEQAVCAIGERHEIERLCVNLISNAVKYSPEDGQVSVQLSHVGDDRVRVTVTDHGLGISRHDQTRLFDEFFRSSNPDATRRPGTGLGLAIVKRIVDRHAGSIRVESKLGEGSTFEVTLPAAATC